MHLLSFSGIMFTFYFRLILIYGNKKEVVIILCFLCRQRFTNVCLDAVSCYLVELQSMSPTAAVQTTIGNFKSLQAKLERLRWLTNTITESLAQMKWTMEWKFRCLYWISGRTNPQKEILKKLYLLQLLMCGLYSCYSKVIYKL